MNIEVVNMGHVKSIENRSSQPRGALLVKYKNSDNTIPKTIVLFNTILW